MNKNWKGLAEEIQAVRTTLCTFHAIRVGPNGAGQADGRGIVIETRVAGRARLSFATRGQRLGSGYVLQADFGLDPLV